MTYDVTYSLVCRLPCRLPPCRHSQKASFIPPCRWTEAADAAVKAARQKAENVHDNLDHSDNNGDPKTPIGQGVKQIKDAKDKVKQVDDALQAVHTDLGNWKNAASGVLGAAVGKARDVHGKLNPDETDDQHKIGQNIDKIHTSNEAIKEANITLGKQVGSLHSWINTAEDIRSKAEQKAKEAYEKLDVHAELSRNVQKIVDANKAIQKVNKSLNGVHGNLGEWNEEANTVLQGAIDRANEVYENLNPEKNGGGTNGHVGIKIGDIEDNNAAIKQANEQLKEHVTSLEHWKTAAEKIVQAGQKKCEEILKRVDDKTKGSGQVAIKEQAEALRKKAESLLNAYSQAHGNVTGLVSKVTEAVKDLEAGMKDDLRRLQKDIVNSMKKHVGEMLLQIKGQVGQIKGKDRGDWGNSGASGLLGIEEAVHNYATAFRNDNFAEIAKGWLEATVLKHNGTVRRILGWKHGHNMTGNISAFAIGMKTRLSDDVNSVAKEAFKSVNIVSGGITESIQAVQRLCEEIATALDKELYTAERKTVDYVKEKALNVGRLVANIKNCVCECDAQCTKCKNGECGKKAAAELIMCALTSTVRQVGNELESVFLGGGAKVGGNRSIAQELDSVVSLTRTLDDNLGEAEKEAKNDHQPSTPGNQDNEILNKVKGVEQQVKSAMKETTSIDENFKQIMPLYEAAKGENGVGDHKYHNLLKTDIPNALKDFAPHVDNGKNEGIIKQKTEEIKKHLSTIDGELQEIARLVDKGKGQAPAGQKDGVKDYLGDLEKMVTNKNGEHSISSKLDDGTEKKVQGLAAIQSKIHGLQTGTFKEKPGEIDSAVEQIKAQLGTIRTTLQNENGATDQDVIKRLQYMKVTGLGDSDTAKWKVGQNDVNGLGNIKSDLEKQNKQLGEQNKIIGDAVRKIQLQLRYLGFKLDHDFVPDDIMDQLQKLKSEIDKVDYKKGNLLRTPKPSEKLDNEATTELNINNNKAKGLENIKDGLHAQQSELTGQPKNIEQGVTQITGELTRLRNEYLNKDAGEPDKRGVIKNMEFMIEKIGTNDDDPNSLRKIKKEINDVKNTQVPIVTSKLNELCAKIASEAGSVDWKLGLFKENNIDKDLEKIKSQIDTLRIDDLHKAIAMCDNFLTNAVYIKWEKVENIERFVDSEIEKAIAELSKQARRDYVESAKDALKHFADKVAEELGELPGEINRDLFVGYKGFMKYAYGHFDSLQNVREEKEIAVISSAFHSFFAPLDEHLREEIERVKKQSDDEKNPSLPKSEEPYAAEWDAVHSDVNALLNYLCVTQGFDDRLRGLLHNLTDALTQLRPQGFQKPSTPTLDSVSRGLSAFVGEFGGAYVSRYSGAECREADADKYAKVFLTVLPTLHDAFTRLAEQCKTGGKWRDLHINSSSKLGAFLQRCGYKVSTSPFDQDGELRDDCNGRDVYVLVSQKIKETEANKHLKKCLAVQHTCNLLQLLKCLCNHLHQYYKTCHLKLHPSPRPPCSIYEMLVWCCGLPHNAVYLGLNSEALPLLFEAEEPDSWDSEVALTDLSSLALKAHPQHITVTSLTDALTEVCHRSHSVLTTLLGYGHADGIYACDFNTNPAGLLYPCDADALLCLLYDVLKRLHQQLYLLYRRCLYNTRHGGWLDCWYGRGVGGSSWKCNTMQCANQICDQTCDQICNQSCDQHPKCGVKSPLQSFLEDGLVGFLPHDLSPKDTCVKCSACDTKSPGLPCKTPMGLSNITRLASRASQGRAIMDVLGAFCGGASSPLTRLCSFLTCLLTRPPRTPADLFAFYYHLLQDWTDGVAHRKAAFEGAVGTACFWQRGVTLDVSTIFGSSNHGSEQNMPHLTGDLFSLVECNGSPGSSPSHPCGPYLKPLGHDVRATFAKAHAHLYLSWVVYLTETFYNFLCSLLQDCERNCADATSNCHARSCDNDCTAKRRPLAPDSNHLESCPSIADCHHTTPTLFQYGFVLRDPHSLAGSTSGHQGKRTCEDFCRALQVAVKHMNPLHKLAHETIPEYLYGIRAPFLFCIIALWLTATLYIAHSLLYRMDVLRIRSHLLTTRASHLIDVKALLAGSRRMLSLYGDVDYFDDDFHS
ncbi:Extracellular matrix-binding ebh, putative [Babesia ovata]|uniref:Extracellular matrix-binding ebh, putative n=1 Tax=Babesia ovata TaxID=189622 RepID=A0A2H6KJ36_9APIC|nr:Extracellular matrix-binding ebh, putative [Babesia ovata]GBE62998.1 Extracellular matrix-binding ebh, putative [Babesia ovata]